MKMSKGNSKGSLQLGGGGDMNQVQDLLSCWCALLNEVRLQCCAFLGVCAPHVEAELGVLVATAAENVQRQL